MASPDAMIKGYGGTSLEEVQLDTFLPRFVRDALQRGGTVPTTPQSKKRPGVVAFVDLCGFTELVERLAAHVGPGEGGERVSQLLSEYFCGLFALASAAGGDVVKFAGDALFIVFFVDEEDDEETDADLGTPSTPFGAFAEVEGTPSKTVEKLVEAAYACSQIAAYTSGDAETGVLRCRVAMALGDGQVGTMYVGPPERIEAIVAGAGVAQLNALLTASKPGQLVVDEDAHNVLQAVLGNQRMTSTLMEPPTPSAGSRLPVSPRFSPQSIGDEFNFGADNNNASVWSICFKSPEEPVSPVSVASNVALSAGTPPVPSRLKLLSFPRTSFPSDCLTGGCPWELVRPFVPHPVLRSQSSALIGELRACTIAFIGLGELDATNVASTCETVHTALASTIIPCLRSCGGVLRQALCDDKGAVIIAVFGLAMSGADELTDDLMHFPIKVVLKLQRQGMRGVSVGMATGRVFAGAVSAGEQRREFAVVGSSVNRAARLMGAAAKLRSYGLPILIDASTREVGSARTLWSYTEHSVLLKGISEKVVASQPVWDASRAQNSVETNIHAFKPSTTMVGRADSIADVSTCIQQLAYQNEPASILILGKAGQGKSTFIRTCVQSALSEMSSADVQQVLLVGLTATRIKSLSSLLLVRDLFRTVLRGTPPQRQEQAMMLLSMHEDSDALLQQLPVVARSLGLDGRDDHDDGVSVSSKSLHRRDSSNGMSGTSTSASTVAESTHSSVNEDASNSAEMSKKTSASAMRVEGGGASGEQFSMSSGEHGDGGRVRRPSTVSTPRSDSDRLEPFDSSIDGGIDRDNGYICGNDLRDSIERVGMALLQGVCNRYKLLIIVEDCHWADAESLSFFLRVASSISNQCAIELYGDDFEHTPPMSAVLLLTAREFGADAGSALPSGISGESEISDRSVNADSSSIGPETNVYNNTHKDIGASCSKLIELGDITDEEVARIAMSLAPGAKAVAENLRSVLVHRAAGSPFFARAVSLHLIESGDIAVVDGVLQDIKGDINNNDTIPLSVEVLCQARVDVLSTRDAAICKLCAVLGFDFSFSELEAVASRMLGPKGFSDGILKNYVETPSNRHTKLRNSRSPTQSPLNARGSQSMDDLLLRGGSTATSQSGFSLSLGPLVRGAAPLLVALPGHSTRYQFEHSILHSTLYKSIPVQLRRVIHSVHAEVLINRNHAGDRVALALLAADQPVDALKHITLAAAQAISRNAGVACGKWVQLHDQAKGAIGGDNSIELSAAAQLTIELARLEHMRASNKPYVVQIASFVAAAMEACDLQDVFDPRSCDPPVDDGDADTKAAAKLCAAGLAALEKVRHGTADRRVGKMLMTAIPSMIMYVMSISQSSNIGATEITRRCLEVALLGAATGDLFTELTSLHVGIWVPLVRLYEDKRPGRIPTQLIDYVNARLELNKLRELHPIAHDVISIIRNNIGSLWEGRTHADRLYDIARKLRRFGAIRYAIFAAQTAMWSQWWANPADRAEGERRSRKIISVCANDDENTEISLRLCTMYGLRCVNIPFVQHLLEIVERQRIVSVTSAANQFQWRVAKLAFHVLDADTRHDDELMALQASSLQTLVEDMQKVPAANYLLFFSNRELIVMAGRIAAWGHAEEALLALRCMQPRLEAIRPSTLGPVTQVMILVTNALVAAILKDVGTLKDCVTELSAIEINSALDSVAPELAVVIRVRAAYCDGGDKDLRIAEQLLSRIKASPVEYAGFNRALLAAHRRMMKSPVVLVSPALPNDGDQDNLISEPSAVSARNVKVVSSDSNAGVGTASASSGGNRSPTGGWSLGFILGTAVAVTAVSVALLAVYGANRTRRRRYR